LHPEVAKAERRECVTDRVGRKRLRAAQLDDDPAAKIDAQV